MDGLIEIKSFLGYYHALDVVVQTGYALKVKTNISGTFAIVIDNKDGFLTGPGVGKLINKEITQSDGEVELGTVTSNGNFLKVYGIFETASGAPGIEAPPRIIRVETLE